MLTPRLCLKRGLKRTAGTAAVIGARLGLGPKHSFACILNYHRVSDTTWTGSPADSWNVTPQRLERQLNALAEQCECLPLVALQRRIAEGPAPARPLVCVTFDDGFDGVAMHALPILQRLDIPATAFVVTSCIGLKTAMPFDRWGRHATGHVPSSAWQPLSWSGIESLIAGGLTIGSHSHWHRDGRRLSPVEYAEEAMRSRDILRSRLGEQHSRAFAYPYGSVRLGHVTPDYVAAVHTAGYRLAVSTELGLVTAASDPWTLPRVEAGEGDSPAMILAKVRGALLPYAVTDRLRRAARA